MNNNANEYLTYCYPISETKLLIGTNYGRLYEGELRIPKSLDFKNNKYSILLRKADLTKEIFKFRYNSTIRSIQPLSHNLYIISSDLGGIAILNVNTNEISIIQDDIGNKYNKIWRLLVIDSNNFITIGNYRQIKHWIRQDNNKFLPTPISGDGSALFCLDWYNKNEKIFLTNDYRGLNNLWKFEDDIIKKISSFYGDNNLQKVLTINDNYLIATDFFGSVIIYKKKEKSFKKIEEFSISYGSGNHINESVNKGIVLIGTDNHLILLNKNFDKIKVLEINVKQIFNLKNQDLVLTKNSIIIPNYSKAFIPKELVNYKFLKVGLVGDSQVGKTCFCRYLETSSFQETQSSFGKHVWKIPYKNEEKRLLLFDLAGQEAELFTYFPMIQDSDIILLFFQGIKRDSFNKAIEYYNELKDLCHNSKFYFIQTFSDQKARIQDFYIENEFKKYNLDKEYQLIKVSSKDGSGFDEFYKKVIENFDWENAPLIMKLKIIDNIEKEIHNLYKNNIESITIEELNQKIGNNDIKRLENIILSLNKQGYFDYIESEKLIIINSEIYSQTYTEVAEFITQNYGFIKTKDLITTLGDNDQKILYINNILQYYRDYNIATFFKENDDEHETIIFLRKLKEESSIFDELKQKLPKENIIIEYKNSAINLEKIIHFLSQYPLDLFDISKNEMIFKLLSGNNRRLLRIKLFPPQSDHNNGKVLISLDKKEEIDFKLEKDLLAYILNILKEDLYDLAEENEFKNLSKINDIEDQIKFILKNPHETSYIDFKKELYLDNKEQIAEFIKDIVALTNSAYNNDNHAFLIIGIEEKNNKIISLNNINNIEFLEQKITQVLEEYLDYYPDIQSRTQKISELFHWQKKGDISKEIPFSKKQKNNKNDEKILILKIKRKSKKVCALSKNLNFQKSRGKSKNYNKGTSWIRINSYTYNLGEPIREILRKK
ncbi:MAG: GTP-binding protein [Candidatus Helarchaeota archaeon]